MDSSHRTESETDRESKRLRIYLLPNLMTAGNLFCGFLALTKIVEANVDSSNFNDVIKHALLLILLACFFDFLDGRVARIGGAVSPFGREFDSLADIISFGVAPAFLVHRIVLKDVFLSKPEVGWFIASVFLICGAFRLARFNVLAIAEKEAASKEFLGFPIPAAAGLVASLTYFLMWLEDRDFAQGNWRFILPVIMIFLSVMMVSKVRYPTFKKIAWRAQRRFTKTVMLILTVGAIFILWSIVTPVILPILFTAYLIYGFVRPHISRRMIKEIEEDDDAVQDDAHEPENL